MQKARQNKSYALIIAFVYALFGVVWILFSDRMLADFAQTPEEMTRLQTYKGWFYVVMMSIVVYLLVRAGERRLRRGHFKELEMAERLREQEEKYRSLVETTSDWIWEIDSDCVCTYCSPKVRDILGYEPEELLGKKPFEFMPEQLAGRARKVQMEAIQECKPLTALEYILYDKQGRGVVLEVSGVPITDDVGDVVSFRGVARDVSERKLAEQQREKLVRLLELKNQELQDIVYVASHDLRSPLVNILGFSGELSSSCERLLKALEEEDSGSEEIESVIRDEIRESLGFITVSSKKMSNLLDGMLQVSRIGTTEVEKEAVDMKRVVDDVLSTMRYKLKEDGMEVHVDQLPDCMGDRQLVDRAFSNIIDNAVKYRDRTRKGVIRISGELENGMSIYCIEDNGVGIAREHQANIFKIFHRLEPEGETKGEGLGLTIVRRIADRLDGRVWVESEPGEGSRFYIALPGVS
ncbi:Phytochrome-like protein cph1 [Anaerohalosphaera lusitana]|uniref:histidine kinase n=1 Tax=Anaerohalosphaera lusitana TaxID=1936003 RepID=A0A1U9NIA6_9BACT|nr:PAS domain-containing sensor histidine kinase [Anaerohalosphaera lusitana]AQT67517.1 Phytochrome-like protein cph1 [Anaerohalosphaera lusitana]